MGYICNLDQATNCLCIPTTTTTTPTTTSTSTTTGGGGETTTTRTTTTSSTTSTTITGTLGNCALLNSPNTIYSLTRDVSNTSTCFTIGANNVTLDCQGFKVTYSTSSQGYGIFNGGDFNLTKIRNCNIVQGSASTYSHAIYFDGGERGNITRNNISTTGQASVGISLTWSSRNNLTENKITTSGEYGDAIYLQSNSYNNILSNNMTTTGLGSGFYSFWSSLNNVYSNLIKTSWDLGDGMFISSSTSNTFAYNTIVTTGSNSKGIYLSTSSDNFIIGSYIETSQPTSYGLYFFLSNNSMVTTSMIHANNSYAVRFDELSSAASQNNRVYNCLLKGLSVPVSFENSIAAGKLNYWNRTEQSGINIMGGTYLGGNYYTNMEGTGFSDTCIADSKGFCVEDYDTATNVACSGPLCGANTDYLPLGSGYVNCSEITISSECAANAACEWCPLSSKCLDYGVFVCTSSAQCPSYSCFSSVPVAYGGRYDSKKTVTGITCDSTCMSCSYTSTCIEGQCGATADSPSDCFAGESFDPNTCSCVRCLSQQCEAISCSPKTVEAGHDFSMTITYNPRPNKIPAMEKGLYSSTGCSSYPAATCPAGFTVQDVYNYCQKESYKQTSEWSQITQYLYTPITYWNCTSVITGNLSVYSPWGREYVSQTPETGCIDASRQVTMTAPKTPGTYQYEFWCDYSMKTCPVTVIDTTAPNVHLSCPACVEGNSVTVQWTPDSTDIASYDIQYTECSSLGTCGSWQNWRTGVGPATTSSSFTGSSGNTYAFRARATDTSGNVGEWSNYTNSYVKFAGETVSKATKVFDGGARQTLDITSPKTLTITLPANATVTKALFNISAPNIGLAPKDMTIDVGSDEVWKFNGKFSYDERGVYGTTGTMTESYFVETGSALENIVGLYTYNDTGLLGSATFDFTESLKRIVSDCTPSYTSFMPSGWQYREAFALEPSTPSADYLVNIIVEGAYFDYSKTNIDGSDIRFYSGTSKLNYWIEDWNTLGDSSFWVRVPNTGTSVVNMYYGNPAASSESDYNIMFQNTVFTDGFDAPPLDTSKWKNHTARTPTTYSPPSIGVSGGQLTVSGHYWTSWGANVYSISTLPDNAVYAVNFNLRISNPGVARLYLVDQESISYKGTDYDTPTNNYAYIGPSFSTSSTVECSVMTVVRKTGNSIIYSNRILSGTCTATDTHPHASNIQGEITKPSFDLYSSGVRTTYPTYWDNMSIATYPSVVKASMASKTCVDESTHWLVSVNVSTSSAGRIILSNLNINSGLVTTFSDGSATRQLDFDVEGYDDKSVKIRIPKGISINSATMNIQGQKLDVLFNPVQNQGDGTVDSRSMSITLGTKKYTMNYYTGYDSCSSGCRCRYSALDVFFPTSSKFLISPDRTIDMERLEINFNVIKAGSTNFTAFICEAGAYNLNSACIGTPTNMGTYNFPDFSGVMTISLSMPYHMSKTSQYIVSLVTTQYDKNNGAYGYVMGDSSSSATNYMNYVHGYMSKPTSSCISVSPVSAGAAFPVSSTNCYTSGNYYDSYMGCYYPDDRDIADSNCLCLDHSFEGDCCCTYHCPSSIYDPNSCKFRAWGEDREAYRTWRNQYLTGTSYGMVDNPGEPIKYYPDINFVGSSYPNPAIDIGNDGVVEWKQGYKEITITDPLLTPRIQMTPGTVIINGRLYQTNSNTEIDVSDSLRQGRNIFNFISLDTISWNLYYGNTFSVDLGSGVPKSLRIRFKNPNSVLTTTAGTHGYYVGSNNYPNCCAVHELSVPGHTHSISINGTLYTTDYNAWDHYDLCYQRENNNNPPAYMYCIDSGEHTETLQINLYGKLYNFTSDVSGVHDHNDRIIHERRTLDSCGGGCDTTDGSSCGGSDNEHACLSEYSDDCWHIDNDISGYSTLIFRDYSYSDVNERTSREWYDYKIVCSNTDEAHSHSFSIVPLNNPKVIVNGFPFDIKNGIIMDGEYGWIEIPVPEGVVHSGANTLAFTTDYYYPVEWELAGMLYSENPDIDKDAQVAGYVNNPQITFYGSRDVVSASVSKPGQYHSPDKFDIELAHDTHKGNVLLSNLTVDFDLPWANYRCDMAINTDGYRLYAGPQGNAYCYCTCAAVSPCSDGAYPLPVPLCEYYDWNVKNFGINPFYLNDNGKIAYSSFVENYHLWSGCLGCCFIYCNRYSATDYTDLTLNYLVALPTTNASVNVAGQKKSAALLKDIYGNLKQASSPQSITLANPVNTLDFSTVYPANFYEEPHIMTSSEGSGKFGWKVTGSMGQFIDLSAEITNYLAECTPDASGNCTVYMTISSSGSQIVANGLTVEYTTDDACESTLEEPCTDVNLQDPVLGPALPEPDSPFQLRCQVNSGTPDCIRAYANGLSNPCSLYMWAGNTAIFNCPALAAGTYTATCAALTGTGSNCCEDSTSIEYDVSTSCNETSLETPVIVPSNPLASTTFQIMCPSSSNTLDCIGAYANGTNNQCTWTGWSGNTAVFSCPGMPGGTYTATCASATGTGSNCCEDSTNVPYVISSAVEISECVNLDTENTVYTLMNNVSSAGTCMNITANNVTLDCQGYTINYSQSSTGYGVNNSGGYDYATIKNCNIIQGSDSDWSHALYFNNVANNGTVYSNNITISGEDSNGVYMESSWSGNISQNKISTSGWYSGAIRLGSILGYYNVADNIITTSNQGSWGIIVYSTYNNIIRNNVTTSGKDARGIFLSGAKYNTVYGNNIITSGEISYSLGVIDSSFNKFESNIITAQGSTSYGIYLFSNSTYNNFTNSTILSLQSSGVILVPNGFMNNPENNMIYNCLINGQATPITILSATTIANYWNRTQVLGSNIVGGTALGGNYYTNSSGTGFSDTCVDTAPADGFCDQDYDVDTNTACSSFCSKDTDYLPLARGSCTDTSLGTPVVYPSDISPETPFQIMCPSSSNTLDCIGAYANGTNNQCTWTGWLGNTALFSCPGMPGGTYTATCAAVTGTGSSCCPDSSSIPYIIVSDNNAPNITYVSHNPEPVDIDKTITFIANVTDPDWPSNSVLSVRVCNTSTCSQKVYCNMVTSPASNYITWNCSYSDLESVGLGNKTYYIWAIDTEGAVSSAGPFNFTVKNITIGSLSTTYETGKINVSGSAIRYQGTATNVASGFAFCSIGTVSNTSSVFNGMFSMSIDVSGMTGLSSVYCYVSDVQNIDGERTESLGNLPPFITYAIPEMRYHYPEPVDIDKTITFIANITDPDWPKSNISSARVCNNPTCSGTVYCNMATSPASNYITWNCSYSDLESVGLGNKTYYIWAMDTAASVSVTEAQTFEVRNLSIENLRAIYRGGTINITASNVSYQGTPVNVTAGMATCTVNGMTNMSVISNGNFNMFINAPGLVGFPDVYCYVLDVQNIDGERTVQLENTPPEITPSDPALIIMHLPEPSDIDKYVNFTANITDPDYPLTSVLSVRVCNTSTCSGTVYCNMATSPASNYMTWNCSYSDLESLGLGNHTFYIWAIDTGGAVGVAGPYNFTIKNISIGTMGLFANTTKVTLAASNTLYQQGPTPPQPVSKPTSLQICTIQPGTSVNQSIGTVNGNFNVYFSRPDFRTKEYSTLYCSICDNMTNPVCIDGYNTATLNLNASASNLISVPPLIGPGGSVTMLMNVENNGNVAWTDNNVSFVVNYTLSGTTAPVYKMCESPINLANRSSYIASCSSSGMTLGGSYDIKAYVLYRGRVSEIILAELSSILTVENMTVNVEFLGMDEGYVSRCEDISRCDANYTKGQPVDFSVTAVYSSPAGMQPCDSSCRASYTIDDGSSVLVTNSSMTWFADHWQASYDTSTLSADRVYYLNVTVNRSGLYAIERKKFYVSSEPKLTVVPRVASVPLGSANQTVFNVTFWNPGAARTIDISIYDPEGQATSWLKWVVGGSLTDDLEISSISVPAGSSISYTTNLTLASRAGSYKLVFMAEDIGSTYDASATLVIFAEGLEEFPSIWVILIMTAGALLSVLL